MEHINNILNKLSDKYNVRILFACETGSRAWGFPSPDSDFDIRFIYMHEPAWYLSLSNRKDTIELMDGDFDVVGWDLRKCLQLLKKSNAALIERFQSPVVYFSEGCFAPAFRTLVPSYYSATAVFFHHYALANKFWDEVKGSKLVKLKSYFYLVRSLLSCNWVIKSRKVAPMHMEALMQLNAASHNFLLDELIALKATVGESYLHEKTPEMEEFVLDMFDTVHAGKNNLEVNNSSYALIDEFFIKTLYGGIDNKPGKTKRMAGV